MASIGSARVRLSWIHLDSSPRTLSPTMEVLWLVDAIVVLWDVMMSLSASNMNDA